MAGPQFTPTSEDMVELKRQYPMNVLSEYSARLETPAGAAVKGRLLADSRVRALLNQKVSSGNSWGRLQEIHIVCWYLWYSDLTDPVRANLALNQYLDRPDIEVIVARWVLGIQVEAPIVLPGDVSLVPASALPKSAETEYLRRSKIGFPTFQIKLPEAALIKRIRIPKLVPPDATEHKGDRSFHDTGELLSSIAVMLNALEGICLEPHLATVYRDPSVPFGPFGGHFSSRSHFDVTANDTIRVEAIDTELLGRLLAARNGLAEAKRRRFDLIANRLGQAKRRVDISDKMLDLGVAMEMLLLSESTGREQLSMTFRLRGSWLLGKDAAERAQYFEQLKELYELRSKVAHTGSLSSGGSTLAQAKVKPFESLACKVFQALLIHGEPDWKHLLLGGSK